jgi:diguanylate cyclase (GGDEF)-like protein
MERSRERTPMSKRSKGACSIALMVALVCASFGVGGAAAGDGKYARHLRQERLEARLAGAALAHRTPQQLLLAITPKTHAPAASAPASTPAPTVTTPAATTNTPAATTPATTPVSTPSATTPADTSTTSNDGTTGNQPTGGDTGTTTTGTTTTGTTTTGTTTTGTTTTGTTTTGTTTTPGTTTTGTTTTGTTTTPGNASGINNNGIGNTDTGNANTDPASNHFPGVGGSGSNNPECHGRCSGLGQSATSGVVPTTLPSTATPTATPGFDLGVSSIPSTASASTSPATTIPTASVPTDSSSTLLTPTSVVTPSTSSSSALSSVVTALKSIPTSAFASSSDLRRLAKGGTTGHGSTALLASAGTGGATAGTLAGGTTGRTAGTAAAAGPGDPVSGHSSTTSPKPKSPRHDKHQSSGGSGLPTTFTAPAKALIQVVKVIPTAVWIALAAAFGIALACAAVALRSSRRARRREREFVAISAAAQTDPLTGILNRRGFMDAADRELARASRYDRPFVLAYVDVRGLKAVNDTEGHLVGDELIKAVAGLMKESARADDVVGRIGGDEFALLLGEQTADGAEPVVRRIRAHVEERRAAMEIRVPWELTIGIAAFPHDGTTLEELLGVADRRLYEQRGIALR